MRTRGTGRTRDVPDVEPASGRCAGRVPDVRTLVAASPRATAPLVIAPLAIAPLATAPLEPDRAEARSWLARELARREYADSQPGPTERLIQWILDTLLDLDLSSGPGPAVGVTVLLVVVVAALAIAVSRYGYVLQQRRARAGAAVLGDSTLSAALHRAEAEEHATARRWNQAVLSRFRAVARELEERGVLTPMPGRTAHEISTSAGRWLPDLATALQRGSRHFEDVYYGDRAATATTYDDVRDLDDAVRRARPRLDVPDTETTVAP